MRAAKSPPPKGPNGISFVVISKSLTSSRAWRVGYRAARRVLPVEAATVLVASTRPASRPRGNGGGYMISFLDEGRATAYAERGQLPFAESYLERLSEDRMWCVAVESEDALCSFAWLYEGLAERGMNVGSHPATATEIRLGKDSAFVFNGYTSPASRGRGLMSTALLHAAAELRLHRGVRWLVSTTDVTNTAALAGFRKCGFRGLGRYYQLGVGPLAWKSHPAPRGPIRGFG